MTSEIKQLSEIADELEKALENLEVIDIRKVIKELRRRAGE